MSPSSSVRTEDTLDEDVRRILHKYSKVLTSSDDEVASKEEAKGNRSREGKCTTYCNIRPLP